MATYLDRILAAHRQAAATDRRDVDALVAAAVASGRSRGFSAAIVARHAPRSGGRGGSAVPGSASMLVVQRPGGVSVPGSAATVSAGAPGQDLAGSPRRSGPNPAGPGTPGAPAGRLAVISFHSLEDRLVKAFMRRHSEPDPALAGLPLLPDGAQPPLRRVGRKQRASLDEIRANPRARSAMLRGAEKLVPEPRA